MSVVDQLKNLFSKKQLDSELDSRLSLAMPDVTIVNTDNEMQPESRNAPLQVQQRQQLKRRRRQRVT